MVRRISGNRQFSESYDAKKFGLVKKSKREKGREKRIKNKTKTNLE